MRFPTGEFRDVNKTPFDFRKPKAIGQQISDKNTQLEKTVWAMMLNDQDKGLRFVANNKVEECSKFFLRYSVVFWYLELNKSNGTYQHRNFCFETNITPTQKNFPSVRLNPGEKYNSKTVFRLIQIMGVVDQLWCLINVFI